MHVAKTGIFYMGATRTVFKDFPKEFRSSALARLDRRFAYILAGCALVLGGLTLGMTFVPVKEIVSDREILRIQERYAKLVLNQPREKVKEAVEESKGGAEKKEKKEDEPVEEEAQEEKVDREKETFEQRQRRKEDQREQRRLKREQVTEQVKSSGIFAAITATAAGPGRSESSMSDLLSGATAVADLGGMDLSKGTFAAKDVEPAVLEKRRGSRTSGVQLEKSAVGTANAARIASSGSVNITTKPPEIRSESGAAVTSRACIQRVINRESHRIKRVYENWLKRDPALNGQLKIRFIITSSGAVTDAGVVSSSMNNERFDANILRYVKRWRFDSCAIAESVEIVFPFAFSGTR